MSVADPWLARHGASLVELRRDLHRHPELGHQEHRTTALVLDRLRAAGLEPRALTSGTGVVCDLGPVGSRTVGLRADLDALPLNDEKDVPYRSTVTGVCHACGHDVHTAILVGVAQVLAGLELPGRVRLLFQPAEELMPGGALDVLAEGLIDGPGERLDALYAVHCDPTLEVGRLGVRSGPITAAADLVQVRLSGPGGHTSRPHATVDLVQALATVATGLPAALSRLVDPRAGLALVWGHIGAGVVANAIPREGTLLGTLRVLDRTAWASAPDLVRRVVDGLVAPYGAVADLTYTRGVPPVVNDVAATAILAEAATAALGPGAVVPTLQSLGGEDFAWYLERVPGSMARLGVRPPGLARPHDLHQGSFDVAEDAIAVGVRVLVAAALAALQPPAV